MPLQSLLLFLLAPHQAKPQDAQVVYNTLQQKLREAHGVKYEFGTGPDSWDAWVTIVFEKPGRFRRSQKGYTLRSDGKWLLLWDYQVTHRPAKPSDMYRVYVPGLEALFADHPSLEVFGPVHNSLDKEGNVIKGSSYIEYRAKEDYRDVMSGVDHKKGRTYRLYIEPETCLLTNLELIPTGTPSVIEDVPTSQPQSEVLQKSIRALSGAKSLIIYRTTEFYGKRPINEIIYLPNRSAAYIALESDAPLKTNKDGSHTWSSPNKPLPIGQVALRGFEPFTRSPLQRVRGNSSLNESFPRPTDPYAWQVNPQPPRSNMSINMRYLQDSYLPNYYSVEEPYNDKVNYTTKTVTYSKVIINPKVTLS